MSKQNQLFECFDILSMNKEDIDALVAEAKSLGASNRKTANELVLKWCHDRFGIEIVDTTENKRPVKGLDSEHPEFDAIKRRKNRILARMGFGKTSSGSHALDKDPLLAAAERFAKSHTKGEIKKYIKYLQSL
jgi:hypothetical protein